MGEKAATFQVPTNIYFNAATNNLLNFSAIDQGNLPVEAHHSKLLYQVNSEKAIDVLGGQNHLITGQSIESLELTDATHITIKFKAQAQQKHPVYFYVKDKSIQQIWVNGKACPVNNQIAEYKL